MIDLRSDTVTKPTKAMLEAMMKAEVGDDVLGDDPTVKTLEKVTAEMFGKEAGLFFPSGTMANQVAIKTHVQPGEEVICDQTAHVYRYEGGGIAATSGASVRLLNGHRGIFTATDVLDNINAEDDHFPRTRLICIENTVNKGGGACWSMDQISSISEVAQNKEIPLHLDGARVWNAMIAGDLKAEEMGRHFDTISVCFSKGLGCPVGSVLLGPGNFIYEARRHRKRMGGGMRQSGILAAAGLYALAHHVDRLDEDHEHCKIVAAALSEQSWVIEVMPPETNILLFKVGDADRAAHIVQKLSENHVRCLATGGGWIRFVFHLDITAEMVTELLRVIRIL